MRTILFIFSGLFAVSLLAYASGYKHAEYRFEHDRAVAAAQQGAKDYAKLKKATDIQADLRADLARARTDLERVRSILAMRSAGTANEPSLAEGFEASALPAIRFAIKRKQRKSPARIRSLWGLLFFGACRDLLRRLDLLLLSVLLTGCASSRMSPADLATPTTDVKKDDEEANLTTTDGLSFEKDTNLNTPK